MRGLHCAGVLQNVSAAVAQTAVIKEATLRRRAARSALELPPRGRSDVPLVVTPPVPSACAEVTLSLLRPMYAFTLFKKRRLSMS